MTSTQNREHRRIYTSTNLVVCTLLRCAFRSDAQWIILPATIASGAQERLLLPKVTMYAEFSRGRMLKASVGTASADTQQFIC